MPLPDFETLKPVNTGSKAVPDFKTLKPVSAPNEAPDGFDLPAAMSQWQEASSQMDEAKNPAQMLARAGYFPSKFTTYDPKSEDVTAGQLIKEGFSGLGRASRAAVADIAAGMSGHPSEFAGNLPTAIAGEEGEPLPIDKALREAALEEAYRGPDEYGRPGGAAVLGKISQGIAGSAPLLLTGGGLPAWGQRLLAAGFSADMISKTPELARQLGDEMGKNPEDRDPDKLSSLVSDAIQTGVFAPLAGSGGTSKLVEGLKTKIFEKGASDALHTESEPVLPGVQPRVSPQPGPVPAEGRSAPTGERGGEAPASPDVPQKIAEDLGFRYDTEAMGRWLFTAFDKEGKASTSFVTKAGATPEEIAAKYETVRESYGDQPNAPRELKKPAATPPAEETFTSEQAAKKLGKPLITEKDVESMPVAELADAALGHEAGQVAGLDAKPEDVPRLQSQYDKATQDSTKATGLTMDAYRALEEARKSGDQDAVNEAQQKVSAAESTQKAMGGKANFYSGMLMTATKGEFKGTGTNRAQFLERLKAEGKPATAPPEAPKFEAPELPPTTPRVEPTRAELRAQRGPAKTLMSPEEVAQRFGPKPTATTPSKVRVERGGESVHFQDKDGNSVKITVSRVPGETGKGAFMPEIQVLPPEGQRLKGGAGGRSAIGDFTQSFEQAQAQLKQMLEQQGLPGIHALKVTKPELAHSGSWEPGELEKQPGYDPAVKAAGDKLFSDLTKVGEQVSKKISESRRPEPFGNGPPEYGQWVSEADVKRIPKMVQDHGDFWLVLKWAKSPRQIIKASDFAKHYDQMVSGREGAGDYLREVFVRDNPFEGTGETGPGMVGMGGATAGNFPKPPSAFARLIQAAVTKLKNTRTAAVNFLKTGNIRDALTSTRDAGDTDARLWARQQANDIRSPMDREFGKEAAQAREALAFVRESGNNPDVLRAMKDKIQNSTKADPYWAKKAIDAIDYALYNLKRLEPFSVKYEDITAEQLRNENSSGFTVPEFNNYVPHRQDIDTTFGFFETGSGDSPTGFRHMRTHETLADSISSGIDPKSLDAVDLLESRLHGGQRMINNKAWTDSLRTIIDPVNNVPLTTDPIVRTRPDGTTDTTAPKGYTLERLGNQFVAVHNGYEGLISALTSPSWWAKSTARQNFLQLTGAAKSINLLVDTFHLGRVAFIQSAIKAAGITTFKAPIPSYKSGVVLLDYTPEEITAMRKAGDITPEHESWLLSKKADVELGVRQGLNVGRISDALYQKWIHDLPFVGKSNRWIFDHFQRGAMTEAYLLELERQRGMYKDLTDDQVARKVVKDINARFGQLGRQGIFKSKTAQDTARALFFAPQWNEGLIRSELGAVKQLGETMIDAATGKRLASGTLVRTAGVLVVGQFVANQILNMITRGHPTWENKEEGVGAKLSAWIPDKIGSSSGFFLNPLALGAEISHVLMQRYEKTDDWRRTLNDFVRGRLSNAMKPLYTFVTNTDRFGRGLRQGDVWKEMISESIPKPIPGSAIVNVAKTLATGRSSEAFPGQFQKQLMSSMGVRSDTAPTHDQRISALARDYNAKKGIVPDAVFNVSDYQPFMLALRSKNKDDAKSALLELQKKKTERQIIEHFRTWPAHPFTGQRAREGQFFRSLEPEQKQAYQKARADRKAIAKEALDLVRTMPKTPSATPQPRQ